MQILHTLNYFHKKSKFALLALLLALPATGIGQERVSPDTLECNIVGFSFGLVKPLAGSSSGLPNGNMKDLYGGFYTDYTVEWAYKFSSGWLITLDANMWIGAKNNGNSLMNRDERMDHIFNQYGQAFTWGGADGNMAANNRGLSVRPGVGYIVPLVPGNPNSGLLLKVSGGWMNQQTVFSQSYGDAPVPQLNGRYTKLYDHLRNGVMLTESIGFVYMSNFRTFINFKISFDLSQCWSWSSRPYQIDNLMGLNGKDKATYFDLMAGIRLSWMFPITGKPAYDYYYY